ncbi:MAG: type II secretion system F family protein [Mycobacteriales bacterium]
MIPGSAAVLGGVAIGTGLALAVRGMVPLRPDLTSALDRLHAPPQPGVGSSADPRRLDRAELTRRLGGWLDARAPVGWARTSAADLAILGWSREKLLAQKLAAATIGLALPAAVFALFAMAGIHLTLVIPVAVTLTVAAFMSLLPDLAARSQATEAREDFRRAVGAYFDLVALERAAEGGPVDALTRAATVAHGWAFRRIADTLASARLNGVAPWVALAQLADELGVSELTDLADVVTLAGNDGAAIYDTLLAKARSIRAAALAATQAQANSRSETMTLPAALLGIGFVILVGYPALSRILNG